MGEGFLGSRGERWAPRRIPALRREAVAVCDPPPTLGAGRRPFEQEQRLAVPAPGVVDRGGLRASGVPSRGTRVEPRDRGIPPK